MTGTIITRTDTYTVRLLERRDYDSNPAPRIYVDDTTAANRSALLADLQQQEKALGGRRFAERGTHPAVDDLYDRLNDEIMRVKLEIAREVLVFLANAVSGDVDAAVERAFFSRNAGCDLCPCSPGVIAGVKLLWQASEFDVWVEPTA
jgi:hypothetical protein